MSDQTHGTHTHAHGSEPDDFAVQIADSVESFVLPTDLADVTRSLPAAMRG